MMVRTETRNSRKRRIEEAIAHAIARRWDLAAEQNRALLEEDPGDVEAANRLGKALTKLDDFAGATKAYDRALALDATNAIARKNLARLGDQKQRARSGRATRSRAAARAAAAEPRPPGDLRLHSLIEESGKSAEFELQRVDAQALRRVAAGDAATLTVADIGMAVQSSSGEVLGTIEPRAGLRLRRMIAGGNRYAVVIRHVDEGEATVYIRETHADPSLAGQASFIPRAGPARSGRAPRAYTRASVVQHGLEPPGDEDPDDEQDVPRPDRRSADGDRDVEMEQRGFSETRSDDAGDKEPDGRNDRGPESEQEDD